MSMVKKVNYTTPDSDILLFTEPHTALGIQVAQAVGVDVEGKKIAKKGTPLTGSLDARNTPFTAAQTTGEVGSKVSDAVGVLQHDVDVTEGAGNGSILVEAFVNISALDSDVAELITAEVKAALDGKVQFIKRNDA